MNINDLTCVQNIGDIYIKRDDFFDFFGVCGGKARSALQLIQNGISNGYKSFCTAGSRMSPQCEIVSFICEQFKVECHLFMPQGFNTSVINNISKNKKSFIHRTKVGYNSVLMHDAKNYAMNNNCFYIPFGMECEENIEVTKHQVCNIPKDVKRIVVPCGSGMSMISIIKGLDYYKMYDKVVIGVIVGKNPKKTFARFIHNDLFDKCKINYKFVKSHYNYHDSAKQNVLCGIELDPIYEAKCIPFLEKDDLLWIVGHRKFGMLTDLQENPIATNILANR